MKKLLLSVFLLLLISSCSLFQESQEDELAKQKAEQDKILQEHLKQKELERLAKFDSRNKREKENSLTWYLCFNEPLTHYATNTVINTKNCKEEYWTWFIYFKVKWNSIYRLDNKSEKRILKIITKIDSEPIQISISSKIISSFENILDLKNCKSVKLIKKDIFNEDENKEVYIIEPSWLYKKESDRQIQKDPKTTVCEWYYPNEQKIVLYDLNHKTYFIEYVKDSLVDIESIKFNK